MRLATILALVLLAWPVRAQTPTPTPPEVISTVNGVAITTEAFQTRYRLEVWLILEEIIAFAEDFYAQTPDGGQLSNALRVVFPQQLQGLFNPDQLGDTVLNSMEVDILLMAQVPDYDISPIDDGNVEDAVQAFVVVTQNVGDSPETLQVATDTFYVEAATLTGADEGAVRALFGARLLRAQFFEAVDGDFIEWAFEQQQAADIQRAEDWQRLIPADIDGAELLGEALSAITGS